MYKKQVALLKERPLSKDLLQEMKVHFKEISLSKNEVLISPGSKHEYAYITQAGSLVKYFTTREGNKVPIWFYFDELFDVALCPDGYFLGKPTKYEVTALENSVVLRVSKQQVDLWLRKYPKFHDFYFEQVVSGPIVTDEIRAYQLSHTPLEFLDYLDREYPIFRKRLSSRHMAQFIGVSPEWYSKLKRRRS